MVAQVDMSIIIPVYNVEKYIGACLESIFLQQGFSFEVLVIDDGSTDSTKDIVRSYAQKYPNIQLLSNKRGKGGGGARNTALPHMRGATCFFLDGDDLLVPNSLYPLLTFMRRQNTPIVKGLLTHFCHQRWIYYSDPAVFKKESDEKRYPTGSFAQHLYCSSFLKEHKILFPEDITIADDRAFFCEAFCHVADIPLLKKYIYIYRINHKEGLVSSAINAFSFIAHFKYIHKFLSKYNKIEYYPLYLCAQFSRYCLQNSYYAQQEGAQSLKAYLEACADVISDWEEDLAPHLKKALKGQSDAFWQACKAHNAEGMLAALQKIDILQPYTSYMGIKEHQLGKYWTLYRFLHRSKSLIQTPSFIKKVWYIQKLDQKAKKYITH